MARWSHFLVFLLLLTACDNAETPKIVGHWQGIHLENPSLDTYFMKTQQYIDTMGVNNSPEVNFALYGTTNVDSLRKMLRIQHDSAQYLQMNAVKNTYFHFFTDSIVVVSFNGTPDTGKWHIEEKKNLLIEEMIGEGKGSKTKMSIENLTDKELKLRFEQENAASTVTFKRV